MKHFSRKSTLQTKPVLDGGGRKEVEEGEGVWDVRGIESLYKVCHANPLWSPTEKREKEKNLKGTKMLKCVHKIL